MRVDQNTSVRLTEASIAPNPATTSRLDGRLRKVRKDSGGGKSGLHGIRVPGNARRGQPQGKCHRNKPPCRSLWADRAVRVKRCGKSAPRPWQQGLARQTPPGAKPNRGGMMLCGIGAFSGLSPGLVARSLWQHRLQMNGHPPRETVWTEPGL